MNVSKLKSRAVLCAAGLSMAAAVAAPVSAFAEQNTGTSQTTEVTIVSNSGSAGQTTSDENLTFSTPTVIPFAAKADGTMTGPSASAVKIVNKSVFPVHVTKMQVAEQSPFKLASDVSKSTDENAFQFTVHGAQAAASVDLAADTSWNMGYAGSATDSISLDTTDAKVARLSTDISTAQKAATITWTLASGNAR